MSTRSCRCISPAVLLFSVVIVSTAAAQIVFDDDIDTIIDGDQVTIVHENAEYNCVQDGFVYEISHEADRIVVTETEDPPGGYADCICYFKLEVVLEDLAAGPLTIDFVYLDYRHDWTTVTFDVFIENLGQGGVGAIGPITRSACHDGNPVGNVSSNWTTIRRLFR